MCSYIHTCTRVHTHTHTHVHVHTHTHTHTNSLSHMQTIAPYSTEHSDVARHANTTDTPLCQHHRTPPHTHHPSRYPQLKAEFTAEIFHASRDGANAGTGTYNHNVMASVNAATRARRGCALERDVGRDADGPICLSKGGACTPAVSARCASRPAALCFC